MFNDRSTDLAHLTQTRVVTFLSHITGVSEHVGTSAIVPFTTINRQEDDDNEETSVIVKEKLCLDPSVHNKT